MKLYVVYLVEFKERFPLWRRYVYTFEGTPPDLEQLILAEFDEPDIVNVTIERVVNL